MVSSVNCINRYAASQDATAPQIPQGGAGAPKPSFTSDYYECSYVPEQEKKGSFLGFLAKTVIGAGIIAGGLVGLSRLSSFKELIGKELGENSKLLEKIKKGTAEAGNYIERNVKGAYDWCAEKIKNFRSETPKEEAKEEPKTENK